MNPPEPTHVTISVVELERMRTALCRCRDAITGYKHCNGLHQDSVLSGALESAKAALGPSVTPTNQIIESLTV